MIKSRYKFYSWLSIYYLTEMLPSTEAFYDDKAHPGCLYKHHTRWLKNLPQIGEYSVVFFKRMKWIASVTWFLSGSLVYYVSW